MPATPSVALSLASPAPCLHACLPGGPDAQGTAHVDSASNHSISRRLVNRLCTIGGEGQAAGHMSRGSRHGVCAGGRLYLPNGESKGSGASVFASGALPEHCPGAAAKGSAALGAQAPLPHLLPHLMPHLLPYTPPVLPCRPT